MEQQSPFGQGRAWALINGQRRNPTRLLHAARQGKFPQMQLLDNAGDGIAMMAKHASCAANVPAVSSQRFSYEVRSECAHGFIVTHAGIET